MNSKVINLNELIATNETTKTEQGNSIIKSSKKKIPSFIVVLTVLVIFLVAIIGTFVYSSINNLESSVTTLKNSSKSLFDELAHHDLTKIDQHQIEISNSLNSIKNELNNYSFLADIQFTKGYYTNIVLIKNILNRVDTINQTTLNGLKDILKSDSNSDNTVVTLTKHLPEFIALYNTIEPDIIAILNDAKTIDPNYVPTEDYKNLVTNVKSFTVKYPEISINAKEFLNFMPELLGSGKETTFMLLLQSNTEMRSSGGLVTTVGHASILNGQVQDEIQLEDSWNLEHLIENIQSDPYNPINADPGYRNIWGQRFLMSKGCGTDFLRFQDVGIYPDLYITMNMAKDYYAIGQEADPLTYPKYDFVVIIDDAFATNLLKLIQPITVEGYPGEVTAESLYNYIKAETDDPKNANFNPNKKEIIKRLANVLKEKFLNLPISELPTVLKTVIDSFKARSLGIATFSNPELQKLFDKYSMSGKTVTDFNGDYFQLSEAQNCSKKLNRWVRDTVTHDIYIDTAGAIKKNVYIKWEQPQVYDPTTMTDSMYDLSGSFIYRAWVRLMLPETVSDIVSNGQDKYVYQVLKYNPEDYYDTDLQKEISDNVISFDHRRMTENDPIPTQDLTVSYQLPSSLNYSAQNGYEMLIQKHPGKYWGEHNIFNIYFEDQVFTTDVILDQDKVLRFKDGLISVENYNSAWDWLAI